MEKSGHLSWKIPFIFTTVTFRISKRFERCEKIELYNWLFMSRPKWLFSWQKNIHLGKLWPLVRYNGIRSKIISISRHFFLNFRTSLKGWVCSRSLVKSQKKGVLDISFFRLKWRKQTLLARRVDVNKSQNYVGLQSFTYSAQKKNWPNVFLNFFTPTLTTVWKWLTNHSDRLRG